MIMYQITKDKSFTLYCSQESEGNLYVTTSWMSLCWLGSLHRTAYGWTKIIFTRTVHPRGCESGFTLGERGVSWINMVSVQWKTLLIWKASLACHVWTEPQRRFSFVPWQCDRQYCVVPHHRIWLLQILRLARSNVAWSYFSYSVGCEITVINLKTFCPPSLQGGRDVLPGGTHGENEPTISHEKMQGFASKFILCDMQES